MTGESLKPIFLLELKIIKGLVDIVADWKQSSLGLLMDFATVDNVLSKQGRDTDAKRTSSDGFVQTIIDIHL